jgi:hypothetical protein
MKIPSHCLFENVRWLYPEIDSAEPTVGRLDTTSRVGPYKKGSVAPPFVFVFGPGGSCDPEPQSGGGTPPVGGREALTELRIPRPQSEKPVRKKIFALKIQPSFPVESFSSGDLAGDLRNA